MTRKSKTTGGKSSPVPIRFEADDKAALDDLAKLTGLDNADLVRRLFRIAYADIAETGDLGKLLRAKAPIVPKPIPDGPKQVD